MRWRNISLDNNRSESMLCTIFPPFSPSYCTFPLPISHFPLSSLGHLFPSVSPSVHLSPSHSISLILLLPSLHPKMSCAGIFQQSEFIHQLLPEFQLNLPLQRFPISYVVWLVFPCFLCSSPPPMVRIVTLGENAVITYINIYNLNMPTSQTHSALANAPVLSTVFPQLERFLSVISASRILLILFFLLPSVFFHWNMTCHINCQYVDVKHSLCLSDANRMDLPSATCFKILFFLTKEICHTSTFAPSHLCIYLCL